MLCPNEPGVAAISIKTNLLDIYRNLLTMNSLIKTETQCSKAKCLLQQKKKRQSVSSNKQKKTRDSIRTYPRDRIRFLAYPRINIWCDNSIIL